MSAGRLYDKIGDTAYAKVVLVTPVGTICKICKKNRNAQPICTSGTRSDRSSYSESDRNTKQSGEERWIDYQDVAVNTGYLIEKLEMNLEYKLVSYEMPEQDQGHLSCTLGELFTGMELKLA